MATAFGIVGLAEIGDKSQLVCMTLASRHRAWPVLIGAIAAFAVLNGIAVLVGAAAAQWLPPHLLSLAVGILFAGFGIQSLLRPIEQHEEAPGEPAPGRGVALTAFAFIFMAEFGDKTQLAVAGLSSEVSPGGVWIGATAALAATSALGVWLGRTLLQRLPIAWLHRSAGLVFLLLAALAFWKAFNAW